MQIFILRARKREIIEVSRILLDFEQKPISLVMTDFSGYSDSRPDVFWILDGNNLENKPRIK